METKFFYIPKNLTMQPFDLKDNVEVSIKFIFSTRDLEDLDTPTSLTEKS